MPDRDVDYLLIGGGLASGNCARWLREEGAEGSILLVGREPDPPYERPYCSKGYLRGEDSREATLFRPESFYEEQGVELLTRTSVTGVDLDARVAKLSTKEEVSFGKALLATGANVRRLNVEGCHLEQIHYLRTLGNSDAIREGVADAEKVVLIGGSYIGCEVAASLTMLGKQCTIVMQEEVVLERGFGPAAGRFFQGAVVVGAGVSPDVSLAGKAGLEIGERGGVRTSSRLETAVAGVYAAGDICEYDSPVHGGRPVRIEHWDVAFNHGKTAALNMLGRDVPHETVPYFFSDIGDWGGLEYVGPAYGWDEEILRGSHEDGSFTTFYLEGGAVKAALTVGRSDDLDHARRLINAGGQLDAASRAALADEGSDLADAGSV